MSIPGILVALAVIAVPAPPQVKTAGIALRYNWPAGMTARIQTEQSRERRSGDQLKTSSMKLSARMQVLTHAEGRLIRFDEVRLADLPGDSTTAEASALTEQITALAIPDLVVDSEGEFVRLADVKRSKAAMDAIFEPLMKDKLPELKPGQRQLVEAATSEELLTALGAQEWTMLVASWNGADLEVGETVKFDSEEPTPLAPGVSIKTQHRATLVSRVPCGDDAPAKSDCVLLELRSTPEPASLKALLEKVMKETIEEDPGEHVVFERYDVENTIRLVTEPATLRPHRLETEKRLEMLISSPEDPKKKHSASQVDRRTSRYVY